MSAIHAVRSWWQARDRRERTMLGVMVVALAAFVAWYGLFVPLRHVRDAAQARYDRSVSTLRQAQALAVVRASEKGRRPALDREQSTRLVLQRATDAGVAVSRQRIDADGRLVLGLDSAAAPLLFTWLDTLESDGLAPHSLKVERAGAGVGAEVAIEVTGP